MSKDRPDNALLDATALVRDALRDPAMRPVVASFFNEPTFTVSHVVRDPSSDRCAIIDSVLDFEQSSGRTNTASADELIKYVDSQNLKVEWLLETHAHADHLSAADVLQKRLGGTLAIGVHITAVQDAFGTLFNCGAEFARDGSQFDHLFLDGERFRIGQLAAIALHVPGHTPACMAYVVGDAVFPGDTLFMADYGTARCDFPGGSAATLYRSIRRLQALPDETRLFLCHDYKAPGRDAYAWETTVGTERTGNIHLRDGTNEADFVRMREARDRTLSMPKLILPSVQVNMQGGRLPLPESNGIRYLKLPLDAV